MVRYRIAYQKNKAIKYTSNLDLYRVWERTLRRAGLPVVYSQGFHPQPKINLASPLPLGMTSKVELVDIWLQEAQNIAHLKQLIDHSIPPGINIDAIEEVSPDEPPIQTTIISSMYCIELPSGINMDDLKDRILTVLSSPQLIRTRRDRTYDLRPLIIEISIPANDMHHPILQMHLTATEGKTGRPDEVLLALGIDPSETLITRTRLIRQAF
jgi:radical SAM-linked protein